MMTCRTRLARLLLSFLGTVPALSTSVLAAEGAGVDLALRRYSEIRPGDEDLSLYRLDWAANLDEAMARAKLEARPICLFVIRQTKDYIDLYSGHC